MAAETRVRIPLMGWDENAAPPHAADVPCTLGRHSAGQPREETQQMEYVAFDAHKHTTRSPPWPSPMGRWCERNGSSMIAKRSANSWNAVSGDRPWRSRRSATGTGSYRSPSPLGPSPREDDGGWWHGCNVAAERSAPLRGHRSGAPQPPRGEPRPDADQEAPPARAPARGPTGCDSPINAARTI
jgi:hypothetical protein